jgi:MoaA/NifB/PqqE/SkfB family radical SAM enzyme
MHALHDPGKSSENIDRQDGLPGILGVFGQSFKTDDPPRLHWLLLSLDRTCNLACPSCRQDYITSSSEARQYLIEYYDKNIHPFLDALSKNWPLVVQLDGLGEALVSPFGRHVLGAIARDNPKNVKISLMSNGQILAKDMLSSDLRDRLIEAVVSIDAGRKETYEILRFPGKWEKLTANMEFLAELRSSGQLQSISVAFIVRNENYSEIMDLLLLCKRWNIREFTPQRYYNPGFCDQDAFFDSDVLRDGHPNRKKAHIKIWEAYQFCLKNDIIFRPYGNGIIIQS